MSSSISLYVPNKLTTNDAKSWFKCVQNCLPTGLIGNTRLYSTKDTKESNFFSRKTKNGKWCYVIPLVRDITTSEIHELVQTWNKTYPDGDFLIDYTQPSQDPQVRPSTIETQKINDICDQWAKVQHNKWVQGLTEKGWKFGIKISTQNKTHPLMQPWEQLPTYAKQTHLDAIQDLLKILDNQGYTLSQKFEG